MNTFLLQKMLAICFEARAFIFDVVRKGKSNEVITLIRLGIRDGAEMHFSFDVIGGAIALRPPLASTLAEQ
jgi:hypothetical protein